MSSNSSSRDDRVLAAKHKVCQALGENYKLYLNNMKLWFRKVWTKEQFDSECRKLFTPHQKHLHNEFFLAILNKITLPLQQKSTTNLIPNSSRSGGQTAEGSPKSKKRKRSSGRTGEQATFRPVDLYDILPEEKQESILRTPTLPFPQPRYAAQELFLPDNGFILGRVLVSAWENGLLTVEERVCELIVLASQNFLKNILTAIVKNRKQYRTTGAGGFVYDIGSPFKNPLLRNTVSRQIVDDYPLEIDKEITSTNMTRRINDDSQFLGACENVYQTPSKTRICLTDVYKTLQDRNIVPNHSVHAINIERISQLLH